MRIAGALFSLLALSMASVAAGGVETRWDGETDFTGYETYGWIEGTPAANAEIEAMIREAVERQLEAKGLKRAEEAPDLVVSTHASGEVRKVVDPQQFGYGWGNYRRWDTSPKRDRALTVGSLMVDLADGSSQDLVWRGVAGDVLVKDPKKIGKKIDKVTRKMFRGFPPK